MVKKNKKEKENNFEKLGKNFIKYLKYMWIWYAIVFVIISLSISIFYEIFVLEHKVSNIVDMFKEILYVLLFFIFTLLLNYFFIFKLKKFFSKKRKEKINLYVLNFLFPKNNSFLKIDFFIFKIKIYLYDFIIIFILMFSILLISFSFYLMLVSVSVLYSITENQTIFVMTQALLIIIVILGSFFLIISLMVLLSLLEKYSDINNNMISKLILEKYFTNNINNNRLIENFFLKMFKKIYIIKKTSIEEKNIRYKINLLCLLLENFMFYDFIKYEKNKILKSILKNFENNSQNFKIEEHIFKIINLINSKSNLLEVQLFKKKYDFEKDSELSVSNLIYNNEINKIITKKIEINKNMNFFLNESFIFNKKIWIPFSLIIIFILSSIIPDFFKNFLEIINQILNKK